MCRVPPAIDGNSTRRRPEDPKTSISRKLPLVWARLPRSVRRPVVRLMRHERLRLGLLDRLGIRSRSGFITVSAGGADAIRRAMRHLAEGGVQGDYYEFGLYRGYTFWSAQKAADAAGLAGMRFFGFDSFAGLPEVGGPDLDSGVFIPGDYRAGKDEVERYITDHGFDWSRATLIEGFFDRSLHPGLRAEHQMGPAALVMVDCDLYQSTVPVLRFLRDLLQDGTVVLFDDWYCFGEAPDKGEPRAFREFLDANPEWTAEHLMDYPSFGCGFVMRRAAASPN
ncbi:MAG TPA: TylF/MycF/NovP-related O-methyltransferase [Acidimicrobiales bacterium]|nr:TylF/MycF/NovP-related O-methyltransferase [Acidimicrobiales bacterium]